MPRFVCAWNVETEQTIRFRNYRRNNETSLPEGSCAIWEAARATSAAPFYFPEALIDGVRYWDGAVTNNNPVEEVWAEKGTERVKCMVSLGTGMSEQTQGVSGSAFGKLKGLAKILTQTETNHLRCKDRCAVEGVPYFRFNPTTRNDNIGLDEHQRLDILEKHTRAYLSEPDVDADIKAVAKILTGRRVENE